RSARWPADVPDVARPPLSAAEEGTGKGRIGGPFSYIERDALEAVEIAFRRGRLHAVRVDVVVGFEELAGHARERVLVAVHLFELVDRIVHRAAGLDGLVGAGFGAKPA